MKIKFKEKTFLEIVESYDEENDETITSDETFEAGEIHDVDLLDDQGDMINIQFGDGSVCYCLCKHLIDVIRTYRFRNNGDDNDYFDVEANSVEEAMTIALEKIGYSITETTEE